MSRSFFSKYMAAFALIILISFVLLAAIIGSILGDYAIENIRADVKNSVRTAARMFEFTYSTYGNGMTFEDYIRNAQKPFLNAMLSQTSGRVQQIVVIVTDAQGQIIMATPTSARDVNMSCRFSAEVMSALDAGQMYMADGELDGLFHERHIVSGLPIRNNDTMCGAVFSCSSAVNEEALVSVMNRTVILACLMVMLAACIAVYCISNKMTEPLRNMTNAAKEYGRGKLDTRVQITGKDEIAELGLAFNSMADSIEETEKMRNSFLANVSHDLRTPMTTIAGFVDGMISGVIPPEKQPEYLEIVSSEVHRLSRLSARSWMFPGWNPERES